MSDSHSTSINISKIAGNAPDEIKELLGDLGTFLGVGLRNGTVEFGNAIQSRLRVTDITVRKNPVEENKTEAKVIMEIQVQEDMLNPGGNLHGGCSALLVDV
ncbi:hypothetical protein JR316_0004281 [Psilocybe cubensis]|uniref:Thioesterase domain-containing protein n=2 Tax=Psilocybe cubensis TaxID=181762 RepID=A0A8H8CKU7_PSICU|nr:hypothetical protein JR316_0004281 [Psilocybe cubensis]KAH9482186.1 hypothetical protein JR316_0004281 [Psilocybe cubensis]